MRKEWEVLHTAVNCEISLDRESKILICRWIGFQHEKPLKDSGKIILVLLKKHKCCKILNDNTDVLGPWYHSAEWTSTKWFPNMIEAGLRHFAWVCPKDMFAQLSAEKALPQQRVVKTFYFVEEAMDWLKTQE